MMHSEIDFPAARFNSISFDNCYSHIYKTSSPIIKWKCFKCEQNKREKYILEVHTYK